MIIRLTDKHRDAVNVVELAGEIYDRLLSSQGQQWMPKPLLADTIRQIANGIRTAPLILAPYLTITGDVVEVSK